MQCFKEEPTNPCQLLAMRFKEEGIERQGGSEKLGGAKWHPFISSIEELN